MLRKSVKWLTGILSKLRKKSDDHLPQEDIDYVFTEIFHNEECLNGVKVLAGPYKDVVYYYGRVKVVPPETPNTPAVLSFDYHAHSVPSGLTHFDLGTTEFKQFAGDILMSILLHNEQGEYATLREHDTKEPHL